MVEMASFTAVRTCAPAVQAFPRTCVAAVPCVRPQLFHLIVLGRTALS